MNWPWRREKETTTVAFDESWDNAPDPFDPDAAENGAAGGEPEAPEEPEEPEEAVDPLADLDGDTRALVERWHAGQVEQQRAAFREYGLDLNAEGRPLIADAGKVAGWAGVAAAPRAEPAQAPVAQPAQAAEEPEPEFDPLSATPEDYRRLIQRETQRALQPVLQENQRLLGLVQQESASKAVREVRQTVEARLPGLAGMLDHPDFAEGYQRAVAASPPEYLANPVYVASVAASVCAELDPARMPAPKARDEAGRFAAEGIARNLAQRQTIGGTPPARGGAAGRNQPDPDAERGARIFRHMQGNLPPDLQGRLEGSADAWQEGAEISYDRWKAIKDQRVNSAAGARRR